MTNLSPAAQAIWDEYMSTSVRPVAHKQLAAALHAAVDQIITDHRLDSLNSERNAESRLFLMYVREQFRAIAAELEGAQ